MLSDKEKVDKILQENMYMTISVSSKIGNPWIANLYYAFDTNYNFYWYSPKDSNHSQIIKENPSVAFAIFNSNAVGEDVDAVYIKAMAYEVVTKSELIKGLTIYSAKMIKTKFINKSNVIKFLNEYKDFQGVSKLRLYKAIPEKFWRPGPLKVMNDKFIDNKVEVKIK